MSTIKDGRLELCAAGAWTAAHARTLETLIDTAVRDLEGANLLALDTSQVRALDTFGAWLLERIAREGRARGKEAQITGLPERYRGLLEKVHAVNRARPASPARQNKLLGGLESLGRTVVELGRELVPFMNMLGALGTAVARVLVRPRTFRLTSAVHHLDRVGWQAVPIVLLITFLIGCIIAQQGFFHFRKFGADSYVVDMVGILVLRELGVLIVAIMVAGRSGSAYTAELGSMKMREEIDALRTMGFDPVEVLILPRVIALVIALPILTFIGSMAAP
jgi:phospholipid/cholesterol/gamma-HCH transport system permease protein